MEQPKFNLSPDAHVRYQEHLAQVRGKTNVAFIGTLDKSALLQAFNWVRQDHKDTHAIVTSAQLDPVLDLLFDDYQQRLGLMQKLSLMQAIFPADFEKALVCTLLSLTLAKQLDLSYGDTLSLFYAALFHNVGLLYQANNRAQPFDPKQLRAGAFVLSEEKLPQQAVLALLEQAELADGSGFPSAQDQTQLGDLGQILALTQALYQLQRQYLKPRGLSLQESLPWLRLNNQRFKYKNSAAAIQAIADAKLASKRHVADEKMPAFAQDLVNQQCRLEDLYQLALTLGEQLEDKHPDHTHTRLKQQIIALTQRIETSGIFSECMSRWIQYVQQSQLKVSYQEMEEIHLLLFETANQLCQVDTYFEAWLQTLTQSEHQGEAADSSSQALLTTLQEDFHTKACYLASKSN